MKLLFLLYVEPSERQHIPIGIPLQEALNIYQDREDRYPDALSSVLCCCPRWPHWPNFVGLQWQSIPSTHDSAVGTKSMWLQSYLYNTYCFLLEEWKWVLKSYSGGYSHLDILLHKSASPLVILRWLTLVKYKNSH